MSLGRVVIALALGATLGATLLAQSNDPNLPAGALTRLGDGKAQLGGSVNSISFAPDGKSLVAGGSDKVARLWDVGGNQLLRQFGQPRFPIHAVAFAPDGKALATGSLDDTVTVWEAGTGQPLQEMHSFVGKGGYPRAVAFSPDGRLLGAAGGNGNFRLRDIASGEEVRVLAGHRGMVNSIAFSPDGRHLASCGHDYTLRIWESTNGKLVHLIAEPNLVTNCVAFSPDGKVLASACSDGSVRLLDVASGKQLHHLAGHRSPVRAVVFSPDGRTVASGAADRTIRLWEVATGRERRVFTGSRGAVFALAFAPNGQVLASGGQGDCGVLVWDVTGLRTEGRRPAGERLRPEEAEKLWTDLGSEDAGVAYHAVWALALSPAQAVPLLTSRLRSPTAIDPQRLARILADLDSQRYPVREKATRELEQLGDSAVPLLRTVLAGKTRPSLEVQRRIETVLERYGSYLSSPERLQVARGVEVLEQAGTPEARRLLESLTKQAPGSELAHEASSALRRLGRGS
jgi:dipeptidyl aminopeptidase/acylaminoacyl peptidase